MGNVCGKNASLVNATVSKNAVEKSLECTTQAATSTSSEESHSILPADVPSEAGERFEDAEAGIEHEGTVSDDDIVTSVLSNEEENEEDTETTEHISDFLNLITREEAKVNEKADSGSENEEYTFKMPESFDIPHEYIKEIVPSSLHSKRAYEMNTILDVKDPENNLNSCRGELSKVVESLNSDATGSGSNITGNEELTATLTYKKDKTSKRYKGTIHSQRKNILNPKKDRKKIIANLFNESDEDVALDLPQSSSSLQDNQDIIDTDDVNPTTTPNSSHRSDLQEKRERMKNKLKRTRGVYENIKSIDNVKKRKSSKDFIGKVKSKTASEHKIHPCDSVKKYLCEEDKNWLVSDDHISDDDTREANKKIESNMKAGHLTTSSDDESDSTETAEDRRKRLAERKNKKGGDVLAWMSRRAQISVNVQTKPNSVILDMALYRMKLLAEEEETVSEAEDGSFPLRLVEFCLLKNVSFI